MNNMERCDNEHISIVEHVKQENYHHLLAMLHSRAFTQLELNKAVQIASSNGFMQCVKVLINFGADIHCLNEDLNNAPLLLGIALGGHINILKLLLEYGYDVNYNIDNSLETNYAVPLHIAIWRNDVDMVRCMLAADTHTEVRDSEGNTAVLISCITGSLEIFSLLQKKSDLNAQNYTGESCLHLAIKHKHKDLTAYLLELEVDLNCEDENGNTPIFVAANIDASFLKMMLNCPGVNINHKNKEGNTILHILGPFASSNIMEECLSHGCNLFSINNHGNSVLNVASCFSNEELVIYMLHKYKERDILQKGYLGRTVLHWFVVNNMEKALRCVCLPECDFDLNITDEEVNTPLHLSVKCNNYQASQMLLECGSDPNHIDSNGWNSLHWACHKGQTRHINLLIASKCDLFSTTKNQETCLVIAVKQNHLNVLKILLKHRDFVKQIEWTDVSEKTLLHWAVEKESLEMASFLLQSGCNCLLNVVDNEGSTPLTLSASKNHAEMVQMLLTYGANPNITDRNVSTPLLYVAKNNDIETVNILLHFQAAPNLDDLSSPLIEASKQGAINLVVVLLEHGSHINKRDKYDRTAIVWASQKGNLDIVKLLHTHGADPKVVDQSGDTALTVSAFEGWSHIVEFLLPLSDIDHRELEDGMSALLLALSRGHKRCAEMLIKAGSDVNIAGENGNNALLAAVAANLAEDTIQLILDTKQVQNINETGSQGRNIIHWAVSDVKVLNFLLNLKYNLALNEVDENGATPILLAIAHSFKESAIALLNANCTVNQCLADGRQPIHHAVIYGEAEVLKYLLQKGASPLSLTSDNRSPLLLASIEGNEACVEILLKSEAVQFINEVYLDAITPLSVAVNGSHYITMERLLKAGAKPDLIGSKKHKPLVTAINNNDYKATMILLQWGAEIDQCGDLNNHPVTVASVKQRWNILGLLLGVMTNTNITRRILKGGAIYYFVLDESVRRYLKGFVNEPPSLRKLSRTIVRKTVKNPLQTNIIKLFLGPLLKNYLLFNEI